MSTPVGIVLARCDLLLNNVSWMPTGIPCVLSKTGSQTTVARAE